MTIEIDNRAFFLGNHRLVYSLYYLDFSAGHEYEAPSLGGMFKKMLVKWANALRKINNENSPMFLPFAPDDQEIDCLKATLRGDKIELTLAEVKGDGYAFDWNDIEGFVMSRHDTFRESAEVLAVFGKEEVIDMLLNARVVDQ